MPSALTYPGVYVEEVPSGVRAITGVATSVTAFMGRAQRGPVGEPIVLSSFSDFERVFGGLWLDSPLGFAVADFFRNGGSQAIVVRLFQPKLDASSHAIESRAKVDIGSGALTLWAVNAGDWGNRLSAELTPSDATSEMVKDIAGRLRVNAGDLFNLKITYAGSSGPTLENFANVTLKESTRRVDRVLGQSSRLVTGTVDAAKEEAFKTALTPTAATPPKPSTCAFVGGADSAFLTDANYTATGLPALERADAVNLLCIPPDSQDGEIAPKVYTEALNACVRRRAMLIVDPPKAWTGLSADAIRLTDLSLSGPAARNAAVFYPRVQQPNPLRGGQLEEFVPCGVVAGIMARTDVQRGVWKAPAGLDATVSGVQSLSVKLTDADSGLLNPQGINCLRSFPVTGQVIWGARTLRGADMLADEYKYISVRRLALYVEESIYRGTQWVVFEPNDEPLWSQIRLNVGAFMQSLFRRGAFQGQTPTEAYFVKCDKETTTPYDINNGVVNIVVGFAPLKPAEFVVLKFQQMAGQSAA